MYFIAIFRVARLNLLAQPKILSPTGTTFPAPNSPQTSNATFSSSVCALSLIRSECTRSRASSKSLSIRRSELWWKGQANSSLAASRTSNERQRLSRRYLQAKLRLAASRTSMRKCKYRRGVGRKGITRLFKRGERRLAKVNDALVHICESSYYDALPAVTRILEWCRDDQTSYELPPRALD